MDPAPPKLPNTASRLIAMAVSLPGEAQAVALEMKCSSSDFVSLVVREQGKALARNRERIAPIRAQLKVR